MPFDSKFTLSPREARSIQEWGKQLLIPARTLLHHASQGELKVHIRRPLGAAEWALVRLDESAMPLDTKTYIWFPKYEIEGFVPDTSTLYALLSSDLAEVSSFATVVSRNMGWDLVRGLVPSTGNHTFRAPGWEMRGFEVGGVSTDSGLMNLRNALKHGQADQKLQQFKLKIRLSDISITQAEIQSFASRLRSYAFISDLFSNGKFSTARPDYLSKKLVEMIEGNQIYWRNSENLAVEERKRRRTATREYLELDFRALCKKGTSPGGLVKFAAGACDPTLGSASRRVGASATSDLLALVTAAKLLWSSPHVDYNDPRTHPTREQVGVFLRSMGVTSENAASAGTTIVRPE